MGRERKSRKPADFPGETASRAGVAATGETDNRAREDNASKIYYVKKMPVRSAAVSVPGS